MKSRVLLAHLGAATTGAVISTAVTAPARADSGLQASDVSATDIAYRLGYLAPAVCCLAVVIAIVIIVARRFNKR
ncbi:hypothetical protein [Dactylosporangium sp. NPDC051484]|uniref:hypothetical protein n=1 Tax=Dactylosporangium sp. NPDC051484 TaxID=3154942 RepID=UPI00344F5240